MTFDFSEFELAPVPRAPKQKARELSKTEKAVLALLSDEWQTVKEITAKQERAFNTVSGALTRLYSMDRLTRKGEPVGGYFYRRAEGQG